MKFHNYLKYSINNNLIKKKNVNKNKRIKTMFINYYKVRYLVV